MLPTRARRQSAPKLTAEIGDVVDRVVGETDTRKRLTNNTLDEEARLEL